MTDLISSFKAVLYDRVSSPLFSSVLIAWAAWNHRIFFVLISNLDVSKKFDYIDEHLYPTWREVLGRGSFYPLLSALLLIYVLPIPARWVYEYTRAEQKKLKLIQQRIDDETPLTQEEARALKTVIRKADEDFEKSISARNELISRLRTEISKLEAKQQETEASTKDGPGNKKIEEVVSSDLDTRSIHILKKIASQPNGLERAKIFTFVNERDTILYQYSIDELIKENFVERSLLPGPERYISTAKGRAFLVGLNATENPDDPREPDSGIHQLNIPGP